MKKITYSMILLLRLKLKRFYIQIQYPFLIIRLKPDGLKSFLMQLEVVLEFKKTKEELGPSIRMSMLHYLSQNGASKFHVGAT